MNAISPSADTATYLRCIEASQAGRWELDRDVIRGRRFDTEARAAALIKSRHAVTVFDHGVTPDGQPYIVMEYLEGESLEAALRRRGALPLAEVIEIVGQAARALEVAHAVGVVHRDLKPDNILVKIGRAYV